MVEVGFAIAFVASEQEEFIAHPEEAYSIDRNLKFRVSIAREFERLMREGVPVADLQEVEESESEGTKESYAVAQA